MHVRMTKTARVRGMKNALICGVGALAAWFLFAVAITFATGKALRATAGPAFLLLWGLTLAGFVGAWLYGHQAGGQVVLDCGPHPGRKIFLLNALLFPLLNLPGAWSANFFLGVFTPVFGISMAIFWLILALSRFQIREGGIWCYSSLLRWGKIDTYRWANDNTLLLQTKGRWWLLNRGALPIAPELKEAVEQLLQKHLQAQPVA